MVMKTHSQEEPGKWQLACTWGPVDLHPQHGGACRGQCLERELGGADGAPPDLEAHREQSTTSTMGQVSSVTLTTILDRV